MSICFITGCARSGTTSLLRALGLSPHAEVALEPMPTLNQESRDLYDGRLTNPTAVLARDVAPRVAPALDRGKTYIEKHVSLVPFIPYLAELFPCRFLIPVRDGRDVVRSMIDWHTRFMPIIYQECREPTALGPEAKKVLARQKGPDPFDQSLPRPDKHDPWHEAWPKFSRFEMCAWYWDFVTRYVGRAIRKLDPDRYLIVDYTRPTVETIRRCYDFLGIGGFDAQRVGKVLDKKVNSLADRIGQSAAMPGWKDWPAAQTQRFWELAFGGMRELGMAPSRVRPEPPNFGAYWLGREVDPAAYEKMYDYRKGSQAQFRAWVSKVESAGGLINQPIDVGSGIGTGQTTLFADRNYIGIDLSEQVIRWANERATAGHRFIQHDVLKDPNGPTGDLVFSHSTIDNVYDPDEYLRALARRTTRLLYVANYRGFFNGLRDHRIQWDPKMGVCFNDVSPARAREVLEEEGFAAVEVLPFRTGREDVPIETLMVASRRAEDGPALAAGHDVQFPWRPYRIARCPWPLKDLLLVVNRGCASFSAGGLDLANPLSYFVRMADDLAALPDNRTLGTLGDLARREGGVNTAIRVDLDMDIIAARAMARIAGRRSVPMSIYLLPTSSYYGYFADGTFHRHFDCGKIYKELQDAGCEIGLHVDGLEVYLRHGMDGATAVREELDWLRSCGLDVRGTTGHNVASVYGAENFELFAGRAVGGRKAAVKDGTILPLGVLDETALGLDYEGSGGGPPVVADPAAREEYLAGLPRGDFLRNPDWMRTYLVDSPYCKWDYDWNIWLLSKDMWVIGGRPGRPDNYAFGVTWDQVRDFVSARPRTESVVFTLHAIYLGQREGPDELPTGYNLK